MATAITLTQRGGGKRHAKFNFMKRFRILFAYDLNMYTTFGNWIHFAFVGAENEIRLPSHQKCECAKVKSN